MGYSNRTWACPYFKWDGKQKVTCEGGCVSLPKQEFSEFVERFCASPSGWRDCPTAKALTRYYERTEP